MGLFSKGQVVGLRGEDAQEAIEHKTITKSMKKFFRASKKSLEQAVGNRKLDA